MVFLISKRSGLRRPVQLVPLSKENRQASHCITETQSGRKLNSEPVLREGPQTNPAVLSGGTPKGAAMGARLPMPHSAHVLSPTSITPNEFQYTQGTGWSRKRTLS